MPHENDLFKEMNLLRTEPSVSRWEIELRRVLDGQREYALIRLVGVQEYIEVILRDSKDRSVAQTTFHEALRHIVQAWQPAKPESDAYVAIMLTLIGAYTPLPGFVKVLGFIQRWGRFRENQVSTDSTGARSDLHMKALVVLGNYYPVAPRVPENEAYDFKTYVSVLREQLRDPRYSGYAAGRLIELEIFQLEAQEVQELIQRDPECLRELMPLLLNPNRRSRIGWDVSQIYVTCLVVGGDAEKHFNQALQARGASLKHGAQGPIICLGIDEGIPLVLPENKQAKYMERRWEQGSESGMAKFRSMVGG